ncbi:uncharacterized protein LOC129581651 [Paramacrobiotus metropolitanus]|uniref:uncharacterized protein LOC129581651 n=1 Tax=Paramacrobiotus metropolitanus TaxID=2943436 RepID=UPI0024458EEE|nr:uncharacterized protein LOC129581651 [Paramacrobiotus metropolitanus]
MHLWRQRVLAFALLLAAARVTALNYVIFAPNSIRSNSTFPVSILVHNATSGVQMDVALIGKPFSSYSNNYDNPFVTLEYVEQSDKDISVFRRSIVIQAGKLTVLQIDVGNLASLTSGTAALVVNGSDSSDSFRTSYGPLTINTTTATETENPEDTGETLVFIQTDQPVYRPKDTVRFRVVSVKRVEHKLHPVFVPFHVQILDHKCNVVQQFSNANDTQVVGYFSGEVPLSAYLQNAGWWIRVVGRSTDADNYSLKNPARDHISDFYCHDSDKTCDPVLAMKDFMILNDPEPRFSVRIVTPKTYYVPSIDGEFGFQVFAEYTPGETVMGTFDVTVIRPRSKDGVYSTVWNQTISAEQSWSVSLPAQIVINGTEEFQPKILIQVSFTEAATGQQETANAVVALQTEAYVVKINTETKTFKPGYPYTLTAMITDWDGRPPLPSTKKAQVDIFYYVYDSLGQSKAVSFSGAVNCVGHNFPSSYDGGSYGGGGGGYGGGGYNGCNALPDTRFMEVHVDGSIDVSVPTPKDASEIVITAVYDGKFDVISVLAKQSPSGSF